MAGPPGRRNRGTGRTHKRHLLQLNRAAQQVRIKNAEIDTVGPCVDVGGCRFHVGDEIVTRRNHRQIHTDQGLAIRNRDQWTIDTVARDGSLTVHGRSGTVKLPADYVAQYVELGYAQTSHASQGRTVDRSILLLDGTTDVRGVYVPMTRGRHHNDAYIVTDGGHSAIDVFTNSVTQSWIDQPALARQAELAGQNRHRPGTLPPPELRALFAQQQRLTRTLDRLANDIDQLPGDHREARSELKATKTKLTEKSAELQDAFDTLSKYDRPLRRRGHETDIHTAQGRVDRLPAEATALATKVDAIRLRVEGISHRLDAAENLKKRRPAMELQLGELNARLTDDRKLRSRTTRREQPSQIAGTLGTRPRSDKVSRAWGLAAGQLDQHQTAYGITKGLDPESGRPRPVGYEHSRRLTHGAIARIAQIVNRERQQAREIGSPAMRIGR